MLIWKPVSVFCFSLPPPIVCFLIAPPLMLWAAIAVPPSATIRAMIATTIDGDGRLFLGLLIDSPFSPVRGRASRLPTRVGG